MTLPPPVVTSRHPTPAAPRRRLPGALLALGALCAALSACASLTPAHERPPVDTGVAFKSAAAAPGWQAAQPADGQDRGAWWQAFGDATLDRLMPGLLPSNAGLAAAVARRDATLALVDGETATRAPQVQAEASASRSGGSAAGPADTRGLGLGASWELDLWGRLSARVRGAQAQAEASEAELADARLSAQATAARTLLLLREADAELELLRATVEAYTRSLQIADNRYRAGQVARTDLLQAQTQRANALAELAALEGSRRVLEHALAVLLGQVPLAFSVAPAPWAPVVPTLPAVLPSELLQRRPDIAAAERRVAAANAAIGVARAAHYPSLGLSASLAREGPRVADLFDAPTSLWALGLSLAQSVFDGGATRAAERQARATHAASVADYRQTVLTALQSVEDLLATRLALDTQLRHRREASVAADATEQQVLNRYKAGLLSYSEVVAAQAVALSARRSVVQLQSGLQTNTVALIQALGGGWAATAP